MTYRVGMVDGQGVVVDRIAVQSHAGVRRGPKTRNEGPGAVGGRGQAGEGGGGGGGWGDHAMGGGGGGGGWEPWTLTHIYIYIYTHIFLFFFHPSIFSQRAVLLVLCCPVLLGDAQSYQKASGSERERERERERGREREREREKERERSEITLVVCSISLDFKTINFPCAAELWAGWPCNSQ